ncbi:MAG TPA: ATP-binding protein [Alteraurantiacibacter sp.]|jgi:signal transduction histidine kinase
MSASRLEAWPGRLIAAVIVVQAIFWLAIKPVLIDKPPTDFESITPVAISEAAVERPDYAALEAARFEPVEDFGAWHCCETGYRALRYHIELDEVPEQGLGLYPNINTDNLAIYVNGRFVAGEGDMTLPTIRYGALLRKIYHIQPANLHAGRNEIAFLLVRDGVPYFDYNRPIIGEYGQMTAQMRSAMFFAGEYKFMALAVIGLIALFALIVLLRSERKGESFWFFMLAASWTALSLYYVWIDRPMHGAAHMSFYFCVSLLLSLSWFCWADSWSAKPMVWPRRVAIAVFLMLAPTMVASLYFLSSGENFDRAGEILDYASIGFAIATIIRIVHGFIGSREDRYWEAAIVILLVTLLLLNAVTELTQSINMGYVGRSQPFLILGLAIAFFSRNVRLFRSQGQITALLEAQLDERTAELQLAHARQRKLVRQQAFDEERRRIMRDMHDGLGSNLMSMLLAARRGKAEPHTVAEGLQSVIDEMRLLIDSMDSVGESLSAALATFRARVEPRVREAGFAFDWMDETGGMLPAYGPRQVLQIFRILQEAVINALKHSEGSRITISVLPAADGIIITIADDGHGRLPAETGRGRGLGNMRSRAAQAGGTLSVRQSDTGLTVELALPGAHAGDEAGGHE